MVNYWLVLGMGLLDSIGENGQLEIVEDGY